MGETVLVTGGSGFVGSHCLVAALREGFRVRTTVRTLTRADEVRAMVTAGGQDGGAVEFLAADLTSDAGWPEAVAGVDYVLHVASPFPVGVPKDPDELIVPARDGALRVLRAAAAAGVKRVVQTSSFAAIGYGHAPRALPFTEADWTPGSGGSTSTSANRYRSKPGSPNCAPTPRTPSSSGSPSTPRTGSTRPPRSRRPRPCASSCSGSAGR